MPPRRLSLVLAVLLLSWGAVGLRAQGTGCAGPGAVPMSGRLGKSETTRNFLALTVYPTAPGAPFGRIPELESFPGWTDAGEPVLDADGGWIYAFDSDEAGVGASYFWLVRRARFTDPPLAPTPRQIAFSMAGVDPSRCDADLQPTAAGREALGEAAGHWCGRVKVYLDDYLGIAPFYFDRPLGADERLDLADPDELWNWMRVMYRHESGREPVIDRATFDRGVRLAQDYIAGGDRLPRPLADYLSPCGPGSAPPAAAAAASGDGIPPPEELMQMLGALDAISANLAASQRQVDALRDRIEALLQ